VLFSADYPKLLVLPLIWKAIVSFSQTFPFSGISNMLSLRFSREPGRLVDRERAWKHFNIGVELCLHYPHISLFINML
jgi:hypothetical protein